MPSTTAATTTSSRMTTEGIGPNASCRGAQCSALTIVVRRIAIRARLSENCREWNLVSSGPITKDLFDRGGISHTPNQHHHRGRVPRRRVDLGVERQDHEMMMIMIIIISSATDANDCHQVALRGPPVRVGRHRRGRLRIARTDECPGPRSLLRERPCNRLVAPAG